MPRGVRILTLAAAVLLLGCPNPPATVDAGMSAEQAKARREACEFKAGALASETLAGDTLLGEQMPFEHIVLVMQENRSFDHYLSKLSHGGVTVASPDATNPDPAGNPIKRYHETKYCIPDVAHSWNASHRQFNDGGMDGFVITNEPGGARALGYFDETDLPYYYAVARTFALSDRHFSSVMGPTQPNRLYYWAGTSWGAIANGIAPEKDPAGKTVQSLFTRLNAAKVSWRSYVTDVASTAVFYGLLSTNLNNFVKVDDPDAGFFASAAAGTLASVSVVEASYAAGVAGNQSDEHPASNIQVGQAFTAKVVNAVLASPLWPKTVLIFLYDEHGGFYDSVPPPKACEPDAFLPVGDDTRRFDHLGFRSPLIVVSPFARRGYVSHEPIDHTSVTRFVEARFGLKALTARDANAWPLLDMFDFTAPDFTVPSLPAAVIDPAKDAQCKIDFPPP
ncbi:MAG: Phospholipase 4 precursor [Myxococcaceae bacterium]|nr:Phospholipase 4 precursor [Myxococcaceae bacterium]